ncbi:MAG: cupin domain-containing protein [Candidatus Marinimicrobia bacterium]|jgi:quercetin dioxygenase-like cupin family protein|nr:cupin domain-containing protein [Candidatus Neomarinimicrobiota bacterium]
MATKHVKSGDVAIENIQEGLDRQILGYTKDLMLVRVEFKKGAEGYVHEHHHEQVTYVESGSFEVNLGGEKKILGAGDAFVIESGIEHGAICLEDGVLIDTFSPMREDFLEA